MKLINPIKASALNPVKQQDTELDLLSFGSLYNSMYRPTHRYGMWMLNDAFTIDNVVQEAFLKLWDYRESITSMEHASRFLKQQVKWECHAYFRSPVSRFHRRFTYLDATGSDDSLLYFGEDVDEEEQDTITMGQLKAINDMMPFVADGREKNLMKLYYVDGLSYKQIAARYGISITAVVNALQKGIAKLKAMIVQPQKFFSKPVVQSRTSDAGQRLWLYDIEGLSKEQSQIYRLRMELKQEFALIARSLNLPQAYVQREYVKAWKIVSQQKKKEAAVLGRLVPALNCARITSRLPSESLNKTLPYGKDTPYPQDTAAY